MFGGDFSMINNNDGNGNYTTLHRIYNRVLSNEEVNTNMIAKI